MTITVAAVLLTVVAVAGWMVLEWLESASAGAGRGAILDRITAVRTGYLLAASVLVPAGAAAAVTIERRIQEELASRARAEERFTSMFTAAPTPTLLVDHDGTIRLANGRAGNLLGVEEPELVGRPIEDLVPRECRARHHRLRQEFLQSPVSRRMGGPQGVVTVAADGRRVPVEVSLTPIETDEGPMVIVALLDLTERREAEQVLERWAAELARSNRDLEDFAYVASHDLKAPVRAMESLSAFILEDAAESLGEQSRNDLLQIQQRARRLLTLIDGLLQYARVGRDEGEPTWVDLTALTAEIGEMYLPEGFELVTEGELPPVHAPKAAVELVFRNLIMNAVKHHDREQGRVEINGRRRGPSVQYLVTDDGPGIPREHHERVFELFRTLEARDKKEASGLGLTLVKRVLDNHGGSIEIVGRNGRGTSVLVTWPCPPPATPGADASGSYEVAAIAGPRGPVPATMPPEGPAEVPSDVPAGATVVGCA